MVSILGAGLAGAIVVGVVGCAAQPEPPCETELSATGTLPFDKVLAMNADHENPVGSVGLTWEFDPESAGEVTYRFTPAVPPFRDREFQQPIRLTGQRQFILSVEGVRQAIDEPVSEMSGVVTEVWPLMLEPGQDEYRWLIGVDAATCVRVTSNEDGNLHVVVVPLP